MTNFFYTRITDIRKKKKEDITQKKVPTLNVNNFNKEKKKIEKKISTKWTIKKKKCWTGPAHLEVHSMMSLSFAPLVKREGKGKKKKRKENCQKFTISPFYLIKYVFFIIYGI